MNKFALITGSSGGIGKTTATTLAKESYDIFVNSKNTLDKAREVAKEVEKLGKRAYMLQGNIAQSEKANYISG